MSHENAVSTTVIDGYTYDCKFDNSLEIISKYRTMTKTSCLTCLTFHVYVKLMYICVFDNYAEEKNNEFLSNFNLKRKPLLLVNIKRQVHFFIVMVDTLFNGPVFYERVAFYHQLFTDFCS